MPAAVIVTDMTTSSHTTSDPKIEAVQRLYEAYGRGDVDGVLAELADDVDWAAEAAGTAVPWYGRFHGKGEVPRFFKEIGSALDVTEFDVVSITSNDRDVVATVHWTFTVHKTGKTASMYMQHWWRFADGKIAFFRGSEDSLQTATAFADAGRPDADIAVVNRYYAAINERRFADYDELFAPHATLEGPGGITGTGPEAMRAFDQVWTNASSDFTVTTLIQVAAGGKVSSENLVEGTHDGLLVVPGGELPATDRSFGGRYVGTFEVADGRIVSQHVYYDRMIVVEQLMT
jgi:ketosteroid isomerase-like protein